MNEVVPVQRMGQIALKNVNVKMKAAVNQNRAFVNVRRDLQAAFVIKNARLVRSVQAVYSNAGVRTAPAATQ